jgi:lipid-A-disaccharide synthase
VTAKSFMVITGEASGDALAAELVTALRAASTSPLQFFGVGGAQVRDAGVETVFDFTGNAVFGLEALKRIGDYKARLKQLVALTIRRQPDAVICVDFGGFNSRFAAAIKNHVRATGGAWQPKIIQFVSPQVWASRPWRAQKLARNVDLLLTIFPFEKAWYARRVPQLRVEFAGHPMVDRYARSVPADRFAANKLPGENPRLVIFPGSRPSELQRHLPILSEALQKIRVSKPGVRTTMVIGETLIARARQIGLPSDVEVRSTDLAGALANADMAIAKSGTITLECAFFGVPTVAMYKTSWPTYLLAKSIVSVKWIAMPNLLANEEVFPEFVQSAATAENIARGTLEFLNDSGRRNWVKGKLKEIVSSLGEPGASRRAAEMILSLAGGENT